MDYLNNVNLPLPPRDEQDKIVAYLNWKTSMINRMISAKKREIKLLKEYKESAISYYVTHGLTKTEMRPTEIYWLREVPKGWSETKLKYLLKKHKREVPENAELLICSNSGDLELELKWLKYQRKQLLDEKQTLIKPKGMSAGLAIFAFIAVFCIIIPLLLSPLEVNDYCIFLWYKYSAIFAFTVGLLSIFLYLLMLLKWKNDQK